jgi:hypothetical protein
VLSAYRIAPLGEEIQMDFGAFVTLPLVLALEGVEANLSVCVVVMGTDGWCWPVYSDGCFFFASAPRFEIL